MGRKRNGAVSYKLLIIEQSLELGFSSVLQEKRHFSTVQQDNGLLSTEREVH